MTDWFRTAFGSEYLALYAHRNEAEASQLTKLILHETAPAPGARVLDAPCGAGRHLRAFTEAGFSAWGFDLSGTLLRAAQSAGTRPWSFVRADLRAIPFKTASFDLVVNLFSSLGYFSDDETNYAVLCRLVDLCKPGGWLVVDFMNSDYLRDHLEPESERLLEDGTRVHDQRWITDAPARVNKQTTLAHADGTLTTLEESVRLFSPAELRERLTRCGLVVEKEFGDYAGAAYTPASKRIILMGRRR
jgi:SAM-dependent methyltransferase